jgi:hypothetical protein
MLRLAISNGTQKTNDDIKLEKLKNGNAAADYNDESDEQNDNLKVKIEIGDLIKESTDAAQKSEAERNLESLVFGAEASMLANIDRFNKKTKKKKLKKQENTNDNEDINQISKASPSSEKKSATLPLADYFKERKPAWNDPDDNEL